jgi:inner membrane protein
MDPFTQGTLGAALPQATRRGKGKIGAAGAFGFVSGMAADLDILIRSSSDPLLFLEYHRQFTHSFIFIPIGGLLMALALQLLLGRRWKLGFVQTALFCTLGYATHALLDTATSYGTMLLWPFSDERFAWKIISVVDPLFTLPIACLVVASWWKRTSLYARLGLVWAGAYLSLGLLQHSAALEMGEAIAAGRGHVPVRLEVKPSFGNILVWKTLYETEDRFYVDAVLVGVTRKVFPGSSVAKLDLARDLPWLRPGSQQARDVERFRWFSDGFVAMDPVQPNRIIDVRYSIIPNEVAALWSIEVFNTGSEAGHVRFLTHRENSSESLGRLWNLLLGKGE